MLKLDMWPYFYQITDPFTASNNFICVSFIICLIVILASSYGFSRRAALDEVAVQSAHSGFVPRSAVLQLHKHTSANTFTIFWLYSSR